MKKLQHTFLEGEQVFLKSMDIELTILEFIDEEYLLVEDEKDSFPVHYSDITYGKPILPKVKVSQEYKMPLKIEKHKDSYYLRQIQLLFFPEYSSKLEEQVIAQYKIFLVNNTSENKHFHFIQRQNHVITFELKNQILPFQNFFSHTLTFEDLKFMPKYELTIFNDPGLGKTHTIEKKISSKEFLRKQEKMLKENEPSFQFILFDYDKDTTPKEQEQMYIAPKKNALSDILKTDTHNIDTDSYVLDIHADKLGLSSKAYTNGEILEFQMQTFEKKIHWAFSQKCSYFIVIHGIGNGVLKEKIHNFLQSCSFVDKYINQYHPKYGYGCTEIYF